MAARAATLLGLVATPVYADYDPSQYPAYETCALCHGLFGVSHMAKFPNLAGQKPAYIRAQLEAFLGGTRTNDGGQMSAIVTELEPEDFAVVIEWFSTQDPPEPYETDDASNGAQRFADLGCAACHDNSADGDPTVPYLTSQHAGYLAKQMTDFREDRRDVAAMPGMHRELLSIPDADVTAIAAYLSAEPRQ